MHHVTRPRPHAHLLLLARALMLSALFVGPACSQKTSKMPPTKPAVAKSPAPKPAPQPAATTDAKAPRRVKIAGVDGVIFPAQADSADSPLGARAFTPSDDDVKRFEAGLLAFLRSAKPARSPKLADKVAAKSGGGSYKRQYFGTLGQQKERLLRVHFLCAPTRHGAWTRSLILVSDGGDCYFELDFDLATGRYLGLHVHGEA